MKTYTANTNKLASPFTNRTSPVGRGSESFCSSLVIVDVGFDYIQ